MGGGRRSPPAMCRTWRCRLPVRAAGSALGHKSDHGPVKEMCGSKMAKCASSGGDSQRHARKPPFPTTHKPPFLRHSGKFPGSFVSPYFRRLEFASPIYSAKPCPLSHSHSPPTLPGSLHTPRSSAFSALLWFLWAASAPTTSPFPASLFRCGECACDEPAVSNQPPLDLHHVPDDSSK